MTISAEQIDDNIQKGKKLIIEEKYDEALTYFKTLYEGDTQNSLLSSYIGIIYLLQEDYKNAADFFKKSIEINPENWYPYQKLGEICTIKNIDECAIKYYTETIERNPKNIYSLLNLAIILRKDQAEIAEELSKSVLSIDQSNVLAQYLLGNIFMNNRNYKKAIKMFEAIVNQNPKNDLAWYNLGMALLKKNKLNKLIERMDNALEFIKKPTFYNFKGLAYLRLYNLEDSISSFKEAIKLDPKDSNYWINLADAYIKGNKTGSAKACLKEALDVSSKTTQTVVIWINLGNCYDTEGDFAEAYYCFKIAQEIILEGVGTELGDFYRSDLEIDLSYKITQRIKELESKGVQPNKPTDVQLP